MSKMQMRLDYNNLMREIFDLLNNSEDEMVQEAAWYIGIGLELLTSYMKGIAKLAIERNDKELLEICKALLIVTEEGENNEQSVGEWVQVEDDVIFECSICQAEISTSWDYENDNMFDYCPRCGAKMKGGE